jgi:fructose-1,6-bisphosphatase II
MLNIPSFYVEKLSYGPRIAQSVRDCLIPAITLDLPFEHTLKLAAESLGKRIGGLVVTVLDRPRNQIYIDTTRRMGASLRLIADGDIAAAVAPSLHDSGVDLYVGRGGAPEGILTAAALKTLGGDILLRMWPRDENERRELLKTLSPENLERVYRTDELVQGENAIFCATGISDSPMLPGVKLIGKTAITHSIVMRSSSRTVRTIRAVHDLEVKTIHLRSIHQETSL